MNEADIQSIAATDKRQELSVHGSVGLYLVVQRSGAKSFQLRAKVAGKSVRTTLGKWPALKLKEAKRLAAKARLQIEDARDDTVAALAVIKPAAGITFRQAFGIYMKRDGNKLASAKERWRIFHKDLEPLLGDDELALINRDKIEDLLAAKAEKFPVASHAMHQLLARFFNWSKKEGHRSTRLEHSVMDNVASLGHRGKPKKRFLDRAEIKLLFRSLAAGDAGIFTNGLVANLYTGQRRSAIFDAKRDRLKDDLLTVDMKDPRAKGDPPQTVVWFHPSVMALLPKDGSELFAGRSDDTNKVTTKLVAKMSDLAGYDVPHWSPHDLRRSMSNWMGDQLRDDDTRLIDGFTIERCMSHIEAGVRAKHYSVNEYLPVKKRAWKLWGDYLDQLRDEVAMSNL